jgi:hypothetical protein
MSRWGTARPPDEAYSRVTNPGRYAPLHDIASELLDRLGAAFDVDAESGYGLDPELENQGVARPSRRLSPRAENAAPLVVAFTTFPGVIARFGRWHVEPFPFCGCDACDESVSEASERLEESVEAITTGRFSEEIRVPVVGDAWLESRLAYRGGSRGGGGAVDRDRANEMLAGSDASTFDWSPWPKK